MSRSTRICLRPALPTDRAALAGLLRGLSLESAYRRFQTGLGPEPRPAVLDALLPDRLRGGAVLAYAGGGLVGHGVWVRAGSAPVAEIGLVVADGHQGRGIGTAMAQALVADLADRGIAQIEVFASATNEAVVRMVRRQAPDAAGERDGATVTYTFAARSAAAVPVVRTVA
jgi:GNAT superfamily N-acetyltransferase